MTSENIWRLLIFIAFGGRINLPRLSCTVILSSVQRLIQDSKLEICYKLCLFGNFRNQGSLSFFKKHSILLV